MKKKTNESRGMIDNAASGWLLKWSPSMKKLSDMFLTKICIWQLFIFDIFLTFTKIHLHMTCILPHKLKFLYNKIWQQFCSVSPKMSNWCFEPFLKHIGGKHVYFNYCITENAGGMKLIIFFYVFPFWSPCGLEFQLISWHSLTCKYSWEKF